MAWTTADLLTSIKNSQMFPDASTGSLSSAALLQYATEELHITLVPMILGMREKYYETYLDTAYTALTPSIQIPSRAIGGAVSLVQFLNGTDIRPLEPIDTEQTATVVAETVPTNFYFQNNSIVLYPPPAASYGTVRMRYFQRPNRLEQVSNCTQITAFDGTSVVTCAPPNQNTTSAWTTSNVFDFIPQTASQATPYNLNAVITAITSTSMTFTLTTAQAALINVGDWIALAEYTPIPEIPFELQPALAFAASCRGLTAFGNVEKLPLAKQQLTEYMQAAVKLLTPRDQQGNKKVVSSWRRY